MIIRNQIDYALYIASPEWRTLRKIIFERDLHRCVACNRADGLTCHHRTYDHVGNELPSDLYTMCGKCHKILHAAGMTPSFKDYLQSLPVTNRKPIKFIPVMVSRDETHEYNGVDDI